MPNIEKNQTLTLQDLRVILHGLKMSGFAFVEPEALDQIKFRIKSLPSPEELNDLADDLASLKRISKEVGEIMHLLEIYGNKNREFKDRHESLKSLPPRYKVLDWRKKMKAAQTIQSTTAIRELVRISSKVDFLGKPDLSHKIITCAKNVQNGEVDEKLVTDIENDLRSIDLQADAEVIKKAFSFDPRTWFDQSRKTLDKGNKANKKTQKTQEDVKLQRTRAIIRPDKAIKKMINQINDLFQSLKEFDTCFEYSGYATLENSLKTAQTEINDLSKLLDQAKIRIENGDLDTLKEGQNWIGDTEPNQKGVQNNIKVVTKAEEEPTVGNPEPLPDQSNQQASTPVAPPTQPEQKEQPVTFVPSTIKDRQQLNEALTYLGQAIKTIKTAYVSQPPTTMPFKGSKLSPSVIQYLKNLSPEAKLKLKQEIINQLATLGNTNPDGTQTNTQSNNSSQNPQQPPTAQEFLSSLQPAYKLNEQGQPTNETDPEMYLDKNGQKYRITKASNGKIKITLAQQNTQKYHTEPGISNTRGQRIPLDQKNWPAGTEKWSDTPATSVPKTYAPGTPVKWDTTMKKGEKIEEGRIVGPTSAPQYINVKKNNGEYLTIPVNAIITASKKITFKRIA